MDKQRRSVGKRLVYGVGMVISVAGLIQVVYSIWLHDWYRIGIAVAILFVGLLLASMGEGTSWNPFVPRHKDKD